MSAPHTDTSGDAAQLEALGYRSEFRRDMSLWANFSLGFTYLSPVVGIYAVFAVSLATGGPPMFWSLLIAGVGQLLVALIFGEVVSQYPLAGGVYPWARRLWGKRWAWMTAWVYMAALLLTIASVAYGAGPYVAALLGMESTVNSTILCAFVIIVLATVINLSGTKALAKVAIIGFTAEIVGALAVGIWLLLTERHHGLGILFDDFGADAASGGSYAAAFLAASLIGVYQYYGFEACGDVAEEVENPGRRIPKAMRMTIYVGGAAATFVCLSLVLSVSDIGAVISGESADPVMATLTAAFGPTGMKLVLGIILISFLSCALSLQAAASRLIYSYSRDRMLPFGNTALSRFWRSRHVPPYALLVAAIVPTAVIIVSKVSEDALTKIISFASLGIYIGFQMVVFAALRARLKGWKPSGPFTLGRWGMAVNVTALTYGVLAMINIAWPRTPDAPWYDNYIVLLSAVVVIGLGLLSLFIARPDRRSDAPSGDAIPTSPPSVPVSRPDHEETERQLDEV